MQCSQCQHVNPAGAKFCLECGAPLARACGHCGRQLPPAAKFCPECGQPATAAASPYGAPAAYTPRRLAEKILTSKAALEGERKQVTVLFADLKGSMELLSDRDPEEARGLLEPVIERMMAAVHHFEGTVSLVMGDGIMAIFGAPLAHEDHAVRACYAAMRMQELVQDYALEARRAHGVNLQIRVGLNSGEVVVGAIGSDLHMDYTAVGRTTHLASRMEQFASPGSILVTRSTLDLAEGFIAVNPLGPVPIRGLAEAVEVYELTGPGPARTRLQAAARRGLTQFTGREAELAQLHDARQRAAAGHGQIVAVIAEAGVGKSRLVYEFVHAPELQDWLIVQCVSVSYGKSTSYLPVINLLRAYFDIHARDDLHTITDKVTGGLLALDPGLAHAVPAVLALLDVPVRDTAWQAAAPSQRREQTLDALRLLVMREARERPILLIFEDLHWADGETKALLDSLVDSLASERSLLLVTCRPEFRHGWSDKPACRELRLEALPINSTARILDALLGNDPGLASLKQRLAGNGNPFFLEETIRTLVETGSLVGQRGHYRLAQPLEAIRIPASVQVMLAARIDRLTPDDKRLLQTAAVIGKDIPFALLQAVTDLPSEELREALDRLQAAEFLYEAELFPDLRYAFKHALTHETAYAGLLQERRRELHARIVEAIETLHRDRLGEQTEWLAHHALRGELREKAVSYLRQAGRKAAARSALPDARVWFRHAMEVLQTLPQSRENLEQAFDVRIDQRHLLVQLGEVRRGFERLREAEALAGQLDDDRRRGLVDAFATNIHCLLGNLDEAVATGTRALRIAGRLSDLRLQIQATSYLEQAYYHRAEYERAIKLATANLAALPRDWVYDSPGSATPAFVFDRCWLVMCLAELGRFAEAAPQETEMLRLAEQTHQATTISQAHFAAGRRYLLRGDWPAARVHFERGATSCRTGSINLSLPRAVAALAWVMAQAGETAEAENLVREGEAVLQHVAAQGSRGHLGLPYVYLGHACLALHRPAEARDLAQRAIDIAPSHRGSTAYALHLLGDIAAHPDRLDVDASEASYHEALALAEPLGMRPLAARCHHELGRLYRQSARPAEARQQLEKALAAYRALDMRFWPEQAAAEMDGLR
jgi:class 3 adenylate cyclase/tetratricopeptide (TPR) repeat protein